jgi:hypothetical protein
VVAVHCLRAEWCDGRRLAASSVAKERRGVGVTGKGTAGREPSRRRALSIQRGDEAAGGREVTNGVWRWRLRSADGCEGRLAARRDDGSGLDNGNPRRRTDTE